MSLQLICVNFGNVMDALRVVHHCESFYKFTNTTVVHPAPYYKFSGLQVPIHEYDTNIIKAVIQDQNEIWIKEIPDYITCDHALSVHWDGFIVNASKWDDAYLEYDWIGAPWPLKNLPNPNWRVGSGGFFLFSKRMAEAWRKICNLEEPFDWQIGALYRDKFEALGMKYAPIELASKFCKECELEDREIKEGESFGFHGFQYGNGYREKYRELFYPK